MVFGFQNGAEEQISLDHCIPPEAVIHVQKRARRVKHDVAADRVLAHQRVEDRAGLLGKQPQMVDQIFLDQAVPRLVDIADTIDKFSRTDKHNAILPQPFHLIAADGYIAIVVTQRHRVASELIEDTMAHTAAERAIQMHRTPLKHSVVATTRHRVGLHIGGAGVPDSQADDVDANDRRCLGAQQVKNLVHLWQKELARPCSCCCCS